MSRLRPEALSRVCGASLGDQEVPSSALESLASFSRLRTLSLHGSSIDDHSAVLIGRLSQVEYLGLYSTDITNTGLGHLQGMRRLQTLDLHNGVRGLDLTEDGMASLAKLPHLRMLTTGALPSSAIALEHARRLRSLKNLHMMGDGVTDQCLLAVDELPALERLVILDCSSITDAGLAPLSRLTGLQSLALFGLHIDGRGLAHISALRNLRDLELHDCHIRDGSLEHLREMTGLRELIIYAPHITDASIPDLEKLTFLRRLWIHPGITVNGARRLQKTLKSVDVYAL